MRLNEKIYQKFLKELQALEDFKFEHADRYAGLMEDVMEDPHTKHLIEVLAFFTARNHLHGEQNILALYRRLFRQYFPFLWSPLPSLGMMQFSPSSELADIIECREGTEVAIQTHTGRRAYFRTLDQVNVFPLQPTHIHLESDKDKETRFYIRFSGPAPIEREIGRFRLYINNLNNFIPSLSLSTALRYHLTKVRVGYNQTRFESFEGVPSAFDFEGSSNQHVFNHPIENLRSYLHYPEQELYLNLDLPSHTKSWSSFTLCFHLGKKWPKSFHLSKDTFLPFTVPIINLQKSDAEIIRCDGTKDYDSILHPNINEGYALHSVLGVYAVDNHKTIPLKQGVLADDQNSYEIEPLPDRKDHTQYKLLLNIADPYQAPKLISVKGLWYQPWFDEIEFDVKPIITNQVLKKVRPRLIGKICSPEDQAYAYDIPYLTRLLAIKNQTRLDRDDLLFLMNALKSHKKSHFKDFTHLITDVKVNEQSRSFSSGTTHEYRIQLEKLDDKNLELALTYFRYMKQFLDLWLPNFEVGVTLNAPNFNVPLTIREGTSYETSSLVRNFLLL